MEGWEDEAAASLDRLTQSPMADAYVGRVRILSLSMPGRFGRYQQCTMELALEVPELAGETLTTEVVLDKRYWPSVGTTIPALISRGTPRMIDADWETLTRTS